MPGTSPIRPMTAAVTISTRGLSVSWEATSWPMSEAPDMRVTTMAAAVDKSMDGICATRPSPMVKST